MREMGPSFVTVAAQGFYRSRVRNCYPLPEIRWNHLIPADYFCFLQLFCEVHFGFLNLTQILTHTGIFPDWTGL